VEIDLLIYTNSMTWKSVLCPLNIRTYTDIHGKDPRWAKNLLLTIL